MDSTDYSQQSNKRQRILATGPTKLTDLPTDLVSNCFAYLDPEKKPGHHIYLASVNKYFKAAVKELYQGVRNNSLESILSSPSICLYVLNLVEEEDIDTFYKIVVAIFENDRLDLYLDAYLEVYPNNFWSNKHASLVTATAYKSTEIMRSLITGNDHIIYFLTNLNPPEGIEINASVDDVKNLVQKIPVACDPQMIKELVRKGVVFNFESVIFSLTRKDIETFKCLLDIVPLEKDYEIQRIIVAALEHELQLKAVECLKERNHFAQGSNFIRAMYFVITENTANIMDLVKMFCSAKPNLTESDFKTIVYTCMMSENMDVLSYLHKSFRKIDLGLFRRLAMLNNKPEVEAHLQSLE
ncbi:predicted protein [Chaetoceros tenuissimus]|uniref:F-box domain-containing protein n=1 Tax=Chaetoceros tenuissimus TaxID=426638 RepID=A0AAD3HBL3_9STRA|nr:predicted protein [Chaetoceros tenuissimus]